MIGPEMEISYALQYQDKGKTEWYVLECPRYEHASKFGLHDETTDLGEAVAIARLVAGGHPYPIKPNRIAVTDVAAVRIIQRINIGGTLLVYGTPNEEDTTA